MIPFILDSMARFLIQLRRRMAGLADRDCVVDGVRFVYSEGGSGEPLVLLHGLGASRATFEDVARYLTPHYRVIIPDLPGFGESDRPEGADYGVHAQAGRVDRFLAQIGIAEFHLGGNSLGGWVAAIYAARHPEKVKSLWLLAAAGTEDMLETEAVKTRKTTGDHILLARDILEYRAVLERIVHKLPPMPYCLVWQGARNAAADFKLHAGIFDMLLENGPDHQVEPWLPKIQAPVLLTWGVHDTIVPRTVMDTYHRLLPQSEIALLDDVGHVPQMEAPRLSAADYLRFRRSLTA